MKNKLTFLIILALLISTVIVLASCGVNEHVCQVEKWRVTKEPTCTEPGEKTAFCSCGAEVIGKRLIDALGHTPGNWIVDEEPSCTDIGSKHKECIVCGDILTTDEIALLAHTAGEWIVDEEPSCTDIGSRHNECTVCGDTLETEEIDALGHTTGEWIVDEEPNCTDVGSRHNECTVCGNTVHTEELVALGHNVKSWNTIVTASCDFKGHKQGKCERCGITQNVVIEKLAHNWSQATCTTPKRCTKCNLYEGSILGHTSSTSCSRCGYKSSHSHTDKTGTCSTCGKNFKSALASIIMSNGSYSSSGYTYYIDLSNGISWVYESGTIYLKCLFKSSNLTTLITLNLSTGYYETVASDMNDSMAILEGSIYPSSFSNYTSTVSYYSAEFIVDGYSGSMTSSLLSSMRQITANKIALMLSASQLKLLNLGVDFNMGNFGYYNYSNSVTSYSSCTSHTYKSVGKITYCSSSGYEYFVCSNCNATKKEVISPTEHMLDIQYVEVEPTCTSTGTKYFECSRCDYVKREPIDKAKHQEVSAEGKIGYETTQCQDCKEIFEKIITYDISYNLNGGISNNPTSYNVETDTFTLNNPTKTGYTFIGWSGTDIDGTSMNVTIEKGSIDDRNYTANWEANTYKIFFDANNGIVDKEYLEVVFNTEYELLTPTREHYEFEYWTLNSEEFTNGKYTCDSDITVIAKWKPVTYTITCELDGGEFSQETIASDYNIETDTFTLETPTKTGYTFIGWSGTDIDGTLMNVTIENGSFGDRNYTANWRINTYTVTLNANGGIVKDNCIDVEYNGPVVLPTPTRNGYKFDGWYMNGSLFASNTYTYDYEVTLAANWTPITYTINYTLNGGEAINKTDYNAETDTFTLVNPTKTGYTFIGWSGTDIDGTLINVTIENGSFGDRIYTANWQINIYIINYDINGGNLNKEFDKIPYNAEYELPLPTRVGYDFSHWSLYGEKIENGTYTYDSDITVIAEWIPKTDIPYKVIHYQENLDGSYAQTKVEELTGIADDIIIPNTKNYAGFTAPNTDQVIVSPDGTLVVQYYYTRNSYKINFVTNGGNARIPEVYKYQQPIGDLPNGQRDGYTFGGWFVDETLTSNLSVTRMPVGDITLYAYWTEENKPADFTYSGINGITISAYNGTSTTMCIPKYIGGAPVIAISDSAFSGQSMLLKVVVPDMVTSIGYASFQGCNSIENITLPFVGKEATASAYEAVFGYIFGYETAHRTSYGGEPSTMVQSGGAQYSSSTTFVNKQYSSVSGAVWQYSCYDAYGKIGSYCVQGTYGGADKWYSTYGYFLNSYYYYIPQTIKNVTITTQTQIPTAAFYNCSFIESINVQGEITQLTDYSFANCSGLKNLKFPQTLESFSTTTFLDSLTSEAFNTYGAYYLGGILYKYNGTMPENYTLRIKPGTKTVYSSALNGQTNLIKLIITDSVDVIESNAFGGCSSLSTIVFEGSGCEIKGTAFSECIALTSVALPADTNVFSSAFSNCTNLTSIVLDVGSNVESGAFSGCINVTSYKGPLTTTIGGLFGLSNDSLCQSLTSVVITSGSIVDSAFANCKYITDVTFDTGITSLPSNVFKGSSIVKVNLPENLTSIGPNAFNSCISLETINLSSSLKSINDYAFYGCTALKEIVIPNDVTNIGVRAFEGCSALENVTIGTGIKTISAFVFKGCTNLTNVKITSEMLETIDAYAFQGCNLLESIYIPASVEFVGEYAFNGCVNLTIYYSSDEIPESWDYNWNVDCCPVEKNVE